MVSWKRVTAVLFALLLTGPGMTAHAAVIGLFDYGYQLDGSVWLSSIDDGVVAPPAGIDESGFDTVTGLGSIVATITGVGAHTFDLFVDHEIDEATNTFFNEAGEAVNTPDAGTSWEIDEPGFVFGDINGIGAPFTGNFETSALDNFNNVPSGLDDDVSMAIGFDFELLAGETASIVLSLATTAPTGGFYLRHFDSDSEADGDALSSIFFSAALTIAGDPGPTPVPAPAAVLLMVLSLGMLLRRRQRLAC